MGDEDEGCARLAVEAEQHVHDGSAGGSIEVARGLIGQEDLRTVDEGTGKSDPLLLAAGELRRVVIKTITKPDFPEERLRLFLPASFPAELQRDEDILHSGECGNELEVLEYEANQPVPQGGTSVLGEVLQCLAIKFHGAGGGVVESGAESYECGFPTARWTDDGEGVARFQRQVDVMQDRKRMPRGAVNLFQSSHLEDGPFDSL